MLYGFGLFVLFLSEVIIYSPGLSSGRAKPGFLWWIRFWGRIWSVSYTFNYLCSAGLPRRWEFWG